MKEWERETKKESFVKTEQIDRIGRDKTVLDDDNITIIFWSMIHLFYIALRNVYISILHLDWTEQI